MNFQFLVDAFATDKEKEEDNTMTAVAVDKILLKNLHFQLWDQNKDDPEKTANHLMDYSHLALDSISLDVENLLLDGDTISAKIHHWAVSEASGFRLIDLLAEVNVPRRSHVPPRSACSPDQAACRRQERLSAHLRSEAPRPPPCGTQARRMPQNIPVSASRRA